MSQASAVIQKCEVSCHSRLAMLLKVQSHPYLNVSGRASLAEDLSKILLIVEGSIGILETNPGRNGSWDPIIRRWLKL